MIGPPTLSAVKTCTKCYNCKYTTEFYQNRKHSDNLSSWCKSCINESAKNRHKTPRGKEIMKKARDKYYHYGNGRNKQREINLFVRYGIRPETHERFLERQEGKCPICLQLIIGFGHIDHNHKTGEVRGVLCGKCNRALGFLGDSPDRLERALIYLRRPAGEVDSRPGYR